jgi:hypothetical protein
MCPGGAAAIVRHASRTLVCSCAVAMKARARKNRKNAGILLFLKLVYLYTEGNRNCKFT